MSDHKFEKQVRQKLDDLKMIPSAGAWENIEEGLRAGKRRREPIFLLLLLLAGVVTGGYYIYTTNQTSTSLADKRIKDPQVQTNQTEQSNASGKSKARSEQGDKAVTESSQPAITDALQEKENSNPVFDKPSGNENSIYNKTGKNKEVNAHVPGIPQKRSKKSFQAHELVGRKQTKGTDINSKNTEPVNLDKAILKKKAIDVDFNKPSFEIADTEKNNFNSPADVFNVNKQMLTVEQKSSIQPPKPKMAKKKSSQKWTFGLNAFAGISAMNEGDFLNFSKPQVEDVSYTANFAQPIAPSYKPSAISPGFSYSIGATARRELTKKLSLSAAINYLQLNTHTKVGERVYGSQVVNNGRTGYIYVLNYYTLEQDRSSEYRNRYHFIEIPVSLHTRINKSEKHPLYWNAGLSVSRLLKSNSLHFDGTTGIYYKNDRLLNQTQAGVTTGFTIALFNNTTRPIWIGPSARYNVSKILQKDVSAKKNFMSLGLDMKLFIK